MLGALGWTAAVTLAAVFAVAGAAKLADRWQTRSALAAFGVPAAATAILGVLLPLTELTVAVALVVPPTRSAGAVAALALLGLFSAAIGVSLARGRAPACRCFGQLHAAPVSGWTLARNAGLGGLGVVILAAGAASPTADGLLVAGAAVLLVAVVAGSATTVVALVRSHGRLLVRLDALERALADAGIALGDPHASLDGLQPGDPAPAFSLAGVGSASLDALLEPGLPVLLVFASPGCAPCHALLPRLAGWEREHDDRLQIAVLTVGELEDAQTAARSHGLTNVLVDVDAEVFDRYGLTATPGAILVAADGTVAVAAVAGEDAVAGLVDTVLTDAAVAGLEHGALVPELALTGLDGQPVPLRDPDGRATLLVFWNPGCGFCSSMRDELLSAAHSGAADAPRLLVLSSGDAEQTRADGLAGSVALDPGMRAAAVFGAAGTPMGLLIDGEGRVASPLAAGAAAVLALAGPPRLHIEQVGR